MRKHEGDTRVRKGSQTLSDGAFSAARSATEQAIVQIGHRRFLQLANRFSKLFSMLSCCLASLLSGSGTGVGQLLCFVARQIRDRTEVSHLRGGVRLAGVDSFYELLFAECAISRGGPARNRVVFINSGRERGKKGRRPEAVVSLTWPYACGRSRPPSTRGGKRPPKALC